MKYSITLTERELMQLADVLIRWEIHRQWDADHPCFESDRDRFLKDVSECKDLREILFSRARCVFQ